MACHELGKFHDIHSPEWDMHLAEMRKLVRKKNKQYSWMKELGYNYDRKTVWKIVPRYRLGRNNPNAHHYHRGGSEYRWSNIRVKREHAQYCTLYLTRSTIYRN